MSDPVTQAKRLVNDPAFLDALSRLEHDYMEAWKVARNPVDRDAYWHKINTLEDLKSDLAAAAASGAVTQYNVSRLRRPTT